MGEVPTRSRHRDARHFNTGPNGRRALHNHLDLWSNKGSGEVSKRECGNVNESCENYSRMKFFPIEEIERGNEGIQSSIRSFTEEEDTDVGDND